ncbi:hypothetical protein WU85_01385 [Corynebacterium striatum]|nr:hypothetical protein WU85_01385 [Corynebacterium striatum]
MNRAKPYISGAQPLSFLTPAKKSLVAVAMVLPMALVACGSDDEANKAQSGDKKTSAAPSTKSKASESADKSLRQARTLRLAMRRMQIRKRRTRTPLLLQRLW